MKLFRVQKFIALSGLCSRRKAEILIEEGRVKVNGKTITLGDMCYETDKIEVNNKQIKFDMDDNIYIVMNKKKGFVTTKADEFNRKTVYDLLEKPDRKENLFSIGRLDKDTSGLLILTTDGWFAQDVIHPSKKIAKEYIVDIDRKLFHKHQEEIEKGLVIDHYKLKPCKIRQISDTKYVIVIFEGRKRQIRNVFEMQGYKVRSLHRIKIGNLDLKGLGLKFGKYKLVSKKFLEDKIFR